MQHKINCQLLLLKGQKCDFHNFKNLKYLKATKCISKDISSHKKKPHILESYKKHIFPHNSNGICTQFYQNSTLHTFFAAKRKQTLKKQQLSAL